MKSYQDLPQTGSERIVENAKGKSYHCSRLVTDYKIDEVDVTNLDQLPELLFICRLLEGI